MQLRIQKTTLAGLLLLLASNTTIAADSLYKAITNGEVDFSARYRYEAVDDEANLADDARASTIRTTLGYKTGLFHAFNAYLQFEDIRALGPDEFSSPAEPDPRYDVVADPIQTSVLQGYIGYQGLADTQMKFGRQVITYRKAPFHRFIGTVAWRQKWQTFDAFSVRNTSLPDTQLSYAYLWRVNRIFGNDAPEPLDQFDSNSHLFNVQYSGLVNMKLQAYSYLLDFDNGLAAQGFSTQTYGGRIDGRYPFTDRLQGLYAAEYAHQHDYADNPNSIDADYFLGELGLSWSPAGRVGSITVKMNYELQEGSGGADRFVTILGTNHPYQGWADRFLVTPGDGVEDVYATAIIKAFGAKFMAIYHDFNSDNGSYDYGTELDLLATKTFAEHYTLGVKYASYDGDDNSANAAPFTADVDKFWLFAQIKY